jgi:hypothetical protein
MITITTIRVTESGTPTEPVTLAELKAYMKVDYFDEDTIITAMGVSARQDIERLTQVKLVPATVSMYMTTTKCGEELPCSSVGNEFIAGNGFDSQFSSGR